MKYKILPILVVFFTLFAINGFAEDTFSVASSFGVKELKSLELLINASDSLTANTNLTTYYFMNSSIFTDGISEVVNMRFRIVIDKSSAQPYIMKMFVNGSACLYSGFDTSLGVGQYVTYFDCTSKFTNQLDITYRFDFNADRNSGNVFILFMPTYINNPDFTPINNMENEIELIFAKVYEDNILSNHDYCINQNTSRKQLSIFTGNSTSNSTTTKMIDTYCNEGCDNQTGKCKMTEFDSGIIVLIVLIGLFVLGLFFVKSRI